MTPNKLVLLDIDGTLLLGGGTGRIATERAMLEVFGTVGGLANYRFAGKTDWYTLVELLKPEGFTEEHIEQTLPYYSEVLYRHMESIIPTSPIKALPGALALVEALAAHSDVLLGLLTGNIAKNADLKLRTVGIDPSLFVVTAYGTESRVRSDLAPLALKRAEYHSGIRFDPSDVVMIGDTTDDIECAHSIGARIIAVATGFSPRALLEQHQPVTVLDSLADTQAVLTLIFGD